MGSKPVLNDFDFGGASRAVNLLDPSDDQDAATKAYVDGAVGGAGLSHPQVMSRVSLGA